MNSEVTEVLVASGTQVQFQIILDPDYLPDYLFASYDYAKTQSILHELILFHNHCQVPCHF